MQCRPLFSCLALASCLVAPHFARAAAPPSVTLSLQLPTRDGPLADFISNIPIHGVIDIVATQPADQSTSLQTAGWELALAEDATLYQSLTDVVFETPLPDALEAGKTYHIPFQIIVAPDFAKAAAAPGPASRIPIAVTDIFLPGGHSLKAVLRPKAVLPRPASPPAPIVSEAVNFKVGHGYSRPLYNASIMAMVNHTDGDLRRRILDRFVSNGILTQADVLTLLENADPAEKGRLSELYSARHYDLAQLHHFSPVIAKGGPAEPAKEKVIFADESATRPFFLSFSHSDKISITWDRRDKTTAQTFRVGTENKSLDPRVTGAGDFQLPTDPGVYPATDDITGRTWGWILIQ